MLGDFNCTSDFGDALKNSEAAKVRALRSKAGSFNVNTFNDEVDRYMRENQHEQRFCSPPNMKTHQPAILYIIIH